jgi:radical SAM superfamily enzyme YgiQ (UPF0313 family)
MNIGLISVDGFNYPNLALMKISTYHKNKGNNVSWVDSNGYYDFIYQSKIFTYTQDNYSITGMGHVFKGGTGYNMDELPDYIDGLHPDYSIYPQFTEAYGFLTRGCPNKCSWCVVPHKEGNIKPYMSIEEVAGNRKNVILMDNNVLASDWGLQQIEKAVGLKLRLDFNQGLDARLIDNDIAKLLSKVKWYKPLRLACDSISMKEPIRKTVELLRKYNCTPKQYFIYVLLKDLQDSYDRINFCKELGLDAFAQPYRDFTPNQIIPQWQRDMARYTNLKQLYRKIDFKDYVPRKNFKCNQYF